MTSVPRRKAECKPATSSPQLALGDSNRALVVVPEKKAEPETKDFDWSANDGSIVLQDQPQTAAYFNKDGSLVIRQRNWPDEDSFIYITEPHIDAFLDKITDVCGVPSVGKK